LRAREIVQGAAMGRTYASHIIAGTRTLAIIRTFAALAGVELPRKFAAALSAPEGSGSRR
jgi:hypothetical protein